MWRKGRIGIIVLTVLLGILAACTSAQEPSQPAESTSQSVPASAPTSPPPAPTNTPIPEPTSVPSPTPAPTAIPEPVASAFPVTVENCGVSFTYDEAPTRAVSMNQHVTEVMLALDLQDHMVGTAYIDDFILPEYEGAYNDVPVLAEEYPSREVLLNVEPDFIYAGFASAFNDENAGTQEDLKALDINSYLTSGVCKEGPDSLEDVITDIVNIGKIFGVSERAEELASSIREEIEEVQSLVASNDEPIQVFMYDSGDDAPYTSVCCAMVTPLIESAGGTNIFGDVAGRWETVNWEEVIARDPEIIVLTDAVWSTAQEKIDILNNNPALSEITAVKNQRFIELKFSSLVPSIRNHTAIRTLAEGFYPDRFD